MPVELPGSLLHEGFLLLFTVGAPVLGALLVSGLITGILQAATQINDPAVGFIPRLFACGLTCYFLGSWMMERMAGFFLHALQVGAGH